MSGSASLAFVLRQVIRTRPISLAVPIATSSLSEARQKALEARKKMLDVGPKDTVPPLLDSIDLVDGGSGTAILTGPGSLLKEDRPRPLWSACRPRLRPTSHVRDMPEPWFREAVL